MPQPHPVDTHNQALMANVHPADWKNPTAAERYNLVVIGGGTAGLVTAAGAAGLGAKVALIESHLLGGDCLNVGCVPSKALIRCARAVADARGSEQFGVRISGRIDVDFAAIMERMRRLRARISPHDSAARFRELGVDVFLGKAHFTGREQLEVGGQTLRFAKACIATGSRPAVPPIPGLAEADPLTNETIFSLTRLPTRLAVVGAGPIGCELAQAFARFGSQVTVIEQAAHILPQEDPEAANLVGNVMKNEGVQLHLNSRLIEVQTGPTGERLMVQAGHDAQQEFEVDRILVSVGRLPNVGELDLEVAGIAYNEKSGIQVNDYLQTTNPNVYAAGDVCFPYRFTHVADAMARIVIHNALFFGRSRTSDLTIPWCTYTDPEIAHVGLSAREAEEKGIPIQTFRTELADVDRAVLDGEEDGLLKIHIEKGRQTIRGATLVARHAGEMISEITLAMVTRRGLRTLAQTIHPYPTQAEVIRKAADAYNRTRLTAPVKKLAELLMRWRR